MRSAGRLDIPVLRAASAASRQSAVRECMSVGDDLHRSEGGGLWSRIEGLMAEIRWRRAELFVAVEQLCRNESGSSAAR